MKYARKYNSFEDASNNIENDYVEPFVALVKDASYGSIVAYNKFGKGSASVPVVDMGTGVGWAEFNLHAESPEQVGGLYMWGETNDKMGSYEDISNYQYAQYNNEWDEYEMTKYNYNDHLYALQKYDDAAWCEYGACWMIPTQVMVADLIDVSTVTIETLNNEECIKMTSEITGNSIYFNKSFAYWTTNVGNDKTRAYAFGDSSLMSTIGIDDNVAYTPNPESNEHILGESLSNVDILAVERYKLLCIRPVVTEAVVDRNRGGYWSGFRGIPINLDPIEVECK
jgi:hypothetical protein